MRPALPRWARWALALLPLRESRLEVESNFSELHIDRTTRYGRWYAHRRLAGDIVSVWRGTPRGGHVFQDLRFGLRLFRKHPAPVGMAVGGLALAIGVVTAVFTLINATMLRPFGMDDPSTVMQVTRPFHGGQLWEPSWPYARFLHMRTATSFAAVEASMSERARLATTSATEAAPERAVAFVSGGYLQMLGGRAAMGRTLTPADDVPSAPPVVVVSQDVWEAQLGADPDVIGATVWLDGAPATLVGVLQRGFTGPVKRPPAVWAPLAAFDDLLGVAQTEIHNGRIPKAYAGEAFGTQSMTNVDVFARLAPGVAVGAADHEVSTIVEQAAAGLARRAPNTPPTSVRIQSAASPIDGPRAGESYLEIASMLAIAGLVLAVACANCANLLLAAAATRSREIGVRLALGATTRRLLGQMVSESLMLGCVAGALGFVLALWGAPLLGRVVGLDANLNLVPDWRVMVFAIAVAVSSGLAAGVAPARYGARGNVLAALQSQSGAAGRPHVPSRLRSSFIGVQAGVSMLLLVAAALLARTTIHMSRDDVGFDADRMLTVDVTVPEAGFDEPGYFRRAVEEVRRLAFVERVALSELRPHGTSRESIGGQGDDYRIDVQRTDAEFAAAAGLRLLRGRMLTEADIVASAPVAVISASVARRFFAASDPIGQPLSAVGENGADADAVIVGVVADALLNRVYSTGHGTVYRPIRQRGAPTARESMGPPTLIVRLGSPSGAAHVIEDTLRRVDPRVRVQSWVIQARVDEIAGDSRMVAWMAGPLAALALLLAALGVYGVTAFIVSRRTQELSVRMALGASASDVLSLVVKDGLRPVAIGLGFGLLAALGAGQVFASVMPGVSPHDPPSILVALVVMLGATMTAVVLPARRASRIDPASILRES